MKAQLELATAWFNELATRERWLVLACAAVLVALLMDLILITPTGNAIKQQQIALSTAQETLKATEVQLNAIHGVDEASLLASKNSEERALAKQVTTLEAAFSELSKGLVDAERLPKILEEMLLKAGNLQLQEMHVEPPAPEIGGLYRHTVSVTLTGGFFDVSTYLKALENLNWNFYWQEINYQVDTYPNAKVELKVYTLSTDQVSI